MLLILAYTVQVYCWSIHSSTSTDGTHGVLGIMLYWHFVDVVWISVVYLVYWSQLVVDHRYHQMEVVLNTHIQPTHSLRAWICWCALLHYLYTYAHCS